MGTPKPTHLVSKLSRKYLKFDLNRSKFNTGASLYGDLLGAWGKYGQGSQQSAAIQEKIDQCFFNDEKEYADMKKIVKSLPYNLNQTLCKIKPKVHRKGRYQQVPIEYREPTDRIVNVILKQNKLL